LIVCCSIIVLQKRKEKREKTTRQPDNQTTKTTKTTTTMDPSKSYLDSSYPLTCKAYNEFYEDADQVLKTEEWENCRSETMEGVVGTIPGGPNKGKPVFQVNPSPCCTVPIEEGGSMVKKSPCGRFLAISPCHGGRATDSKTPNNLQHVRNEISPTGIMSLLHFLIIPNPEHPDFMEKKRFANAMTLGKEDIEMLNAMEDLGNATMDEYLAAGSEKIASLRWWLSRSSSDMVELPDGSSVSEKITESDFNSKGKETFHNLMELHNMEEVLNDLKGNKEFSFHLAKRTVNWLHMHVWLPDLGTENLTQLEDSATDAGHEKNTRLDIVRLFIHSGISKVVVEDEGTGLTRTNSTAY